MSGPLHAWGPRHQQNYIVKTLTVTGDLTVNGNTTLGDATSDTHRVNGTIGINVTAGAWSSAAGDGALQVGAAAALASLGGAGAAQLFGNIRYDGTNYKYLTTGGASLYETGGGASYWYTAPSGTAGNTATLTERLRLTEDGRLSGKSLHNNAGAVTGTTDQYIASGKYTPTLTGVANVAASTAYPCQWMRVGNVVTVSGKVDIDPSVAVTGTTLGMSLPIASNFVNTEDLAGLGYDPAFSQAVAIYADGPNNRAQFEAVMVSGNNQGFLFTFTYEVL